MANLSERLRDLADEGELIHLYPHDLLCRRLREAATILDRLQSLSDQNRLTGGWRDIESAPKDGSYIVAWGKPCSSADEGPWVTRWQDYGEGSIALERWKSGDGPKGTFWHSEPVNNWTNGWKPTHWQPLPSPPLPLPGGEEKR